MKFYILSSILCNKIPLAPDDHSGEKFDYIVIGSGPGGGTVAARLAKAGFKTLVLEAGPDYNSPNVTVPGLHIRASEDPNISWAYNIKQYDESTNLKQDVYYPRGTGIGGCSNMNALISIYPSQSDFDYMQLLTKQPEWSEKKMRERYFRITKSKNEGKYIGELRTLLGGIESKIKSRNSTQWFNINPLEPTAFFTADSTLLELNALLGAYPKLPTTNVNGYYGGFPSNRKEGSFYLPQGIDTEGTHKRRMVYDLLKNTQKAKSNLVIWPNRLATKILFDKNKNAIGVEYIRGNNIYQASPKFNINNFKNATIGRVYANKEVILSAGSFSTPQLLLLSGIGDTQHLTEMGIKTIVDSPGVGRNLQDRYEIPYAIDYQKNFTFTEACTMKADKKDDPCYGLYKQDGKMIYGYDGIMSGMLKKSNVNLPDPDIFTLSFPFSFTGYYKGYSDEFANVKNRFTMLALKSHTKNKAGIVKLKSKDPTRTPYINFRYFEEGGDQDLNALINHMFYLRKTVTKYSLSSNKEALPGPEVKTRKQMGDYIKKNSWGHHACCTAKIGKDNDKFAVLDSRHRVRGVNNLRVVDISAWPNIPGYFVTLPTVMMADKAADDIISNRD